MRGVLVRLVLCFMIAAVPAGGVSPGFFNPDPYAVPQAPPIPDFDGRDVTDVQDYFFGGGVNCDLWDRDIDALRAYIAALDSLQVQAVDAVTFFNSSSWELEEYLDEYHPDWGPDDIRDRRDEWWHFYMTLSSLKASAASLLDSAILAASNYGC